MLFVDVGSDDEATAAALEEKEALAIQKQLAQQLDEGDFGLDIFTVSSLRFLTLQYSARYIKVLFIFGEFTCLTFATKNSTEKCKKQTLNLLY